VTFPAHIIELMANVMLETKSQAIMERVAIFLALQCQGKGIRTEIAAKNAPMGSSTCMIVGKGEHLVFHQVYRLNRHCLSSLRTKGNEQQ